MPDKMDWMEFLKSADDIIDYEDGEGLMDLTAILKFELDDRGYVSSIHDGKRVYRGSDNEDLIQAGDLWWVSLSLNPKTGNNYFARPLRKIDGGLLYEMSSDEMGRFARHIWENNRVILEPYIDDQYRNAMMEEFKREHVRPLEERIAELEAENDRLRYERMSYETRCRQYGRLTEAMAERFLPKRPVDEKETEETLSKETAVARYPPAAINVEKLPSSLLARIDDYTLVSKAFKRESYFVTKSLDNSTLLFREDRYGDVVCRDHTVRLSFLPDIQPYRGLRKYNVEKSKLCDGFTIRLR